MEKLQDLEQFYNLLFICSFICWISPNKPSVGFGGVEMFLLIKHKSWTLCFLIIPGVMPVKSPEFGTGRKFPGSCFMIGVTGLSHVENQMFVCANISLLKQRRVFQSTRANLISRAVCQPGQPTSCRIFQAVSTQTYPRDVYSGIKFLSSISKWGWCSLCSVIQKSEIMLCYSLCLLHNLVAVFQLGPSLL